jgi:predicted acetyltransferase
MDMDIRLVKVGQAQMPILNHLMQLYKYDFSQYDSAEVDANGLYGYTDLDRYGWEPGRYAFLVEADGKWAGFALILHMREADSGAVYYWMAEFFVMKKYRRRGVGGRAAKQLFSLFPGMWRVGQIHSNERAKIFWRRTIDEFTQGDFEEVTLDDWEGPAQQFRSG